MTLSRLRPVPVLRPILSMIALVGWIAPDARAAGFPWQRYASRDAAWYRGDEAARLAANLLSHQSERGDWPKNFDTSAQPYEGDRRLKAGTFDNGATVGEVRFLARAFNATGRTEYRDAVLKALDHILDAPYPNGGFPQSYPPGKGYARYITFNDNTMVNLLELLRDVADSHDFAFVDASPTRGVASGVRRRDRLHPQVPGDDPRPPDRLVRPA